MTKNMGTPSISVPSLQNFSCPLIDPCRGFWHCLSEKGEVYDTTKYGWMEARQVGIITASMIEPHTDIVFLVQKINSVTRWGISA